MATFIREVQKAFTRPRGRERAILLEFEPAQLLNEHFERQNCDQDASINSTQLAIELSLAASCRHRTGRRTSPAKIYDQFPL